MACLQMYNQQNNNNHQSPRLSFSNDFVDQSSSNNFTHRAYRDAPVSSDFEFSVATTATKNSMINSTSTADELFSQGRLLPLKESCSRSKQKKKMMTLKDELEVVDEVAEEGFSLKPPKSSFSSSTRWKGFLGLKKSSNIGGSKKIDKNGGSTSQFTGNDE